jgi:hypothetical protein
VITDSQVGVPRPSKLRRAETTRSKLVGIVTDHYVAKLVALLFAGALVFLIDREITIDLIQSETFEVEAGEVRPGPLPAGQRIIFLQTESGVAIRSFGPPAVKVTIRGQQKLADLLKTKAIVGVVGIKKEWLQGGDTASQTIDGDAVNFGLVGAKVQLDQPIRVDIDPEVTAELTLNAAPKGVAPGQVAEVTFQPAKVKVLGPKSRFEGSTAIEQVTITVPTEGRTNEFSIPVALPPELEDTKHIRLAPNQLITARVRFSRQLERLELKDVPFIFGGSQDFAYTTIGLPRDVVAVTLEGTAEAVAPWRERNDELRKAIFAVIDANKLVAKVGAQLSQAGAHTDESGVVEIVRVPDNLKVVNVIPAQVDVTVTKR